MRTDPSLPAPRPAPRRRAAAPFVVLLSAACATPAPRVRTGDDGSWRDPVARTEEKAPLPEGPEPETQDRVRAARDLLREASTPAERRALADEAARAALDAGQPLDAVAVLLELHRVEANRAERAEVEARILELVDGALAPLDVRRLLESELGEGWAREPLLFKWALLESHLGDRARAREALDAYLQAFPTGRYADRARARLERLAALDRVEPRTVGVLLPLTGSKAAYGRLARQAVELAFDGSGLRVVIQDTADDEATAARAVETLVRDEGAITLLGPVFRTESRAAAVMAQRLGVPLLTISAAEDVPAYGPWVFRNGVTNRAQAEALVEHATRILGFTRFAILHPRHPYGEELRDLFWAEVRERGGTVTAVESYAVDATTFSDPVKRMVGRYEPERREDYQEALEACEEERDAYRKARCRDGVAKDLPPLIDFEALFIPDYARSVRMISAALAAEDIIVEQDPRRLAVIERTLGRTPEVVTLLGPNGWNNPKITESTGRTVENAVFTDGFFARADDERTARFVQAYRERFGREPRLYPEALLYDSARMLRFVAEARAPSTREAFRAALLELADYPGVTGDTSFAGRTDARKTLKLLTIQDGTIQQVPPADAPLPASTLPSR